MSLDVQLDDCLSTLPGCIGAGYIDITSGFMLAMKSEPPVNEDDMELLAVATVEVITAPSSKDLGKVLEADGFDEFDELAVLNEEILHLVQRIESFPEHALCLIFRSDAASDETLNAARKKLVNFSDLELH